MNKLLCLFGLHNWSRWMIFAQGAAQFHFCTHCGYTEVEAILIKIPTLTPEELVQATQ